MITRIVKMKFQEKYIENFKNFTKDIKSIIRNQEGCNYLDILQDVANPEIFFTYSCWNSENDLNNYRNSDFFKNIWPKTKKWFADKPEAWSLVNVNNEDI
ncbi:MAG: antibiotic biosynthesis monooxygenase [Bacteroidales bacterium]|nr:antibiotic biosynthesis monooxygenase [Bacteroidales bacterium]